MKYLDLFLAENQEYLPECTGKTGETPETPAEKSGKLLCQVPAKPPKPGFAGFAGGSPQECSDFRGGTMPSWPPRPAELARWPIRWRQRWGELANQLEDEGVPFPESERRAFDQVEAEMRAGNGEAPGLEIAPGGQDRRAGRDPITGRPGILADAPRAKGSVNDAHHDTDPGQTQAPTPAGA